MQKKPKPKTIVRVFPLVLCAWGELCPASSTCKRSLSWALHPVTTAGSPTAPTCPAKTSTQTPEPSSSSSSAEQRAGSTLLICSSLPKVRLCRAHGSYLAEESYFFSFYFFSLPRWCCIYSSSGWGEDSSPGAAWCGPYTPVGAGHLSGHTNPPQHPALLPGCWGLTDATRILLVSSFGGHLTLSG